MQGSRNASEPGDAAGLPRLCPGDSAGIPGESGGFRGHVRGFRISRHCASAHSPVSIEFLPMLQKRIENAELVANGAVSATQRWLHKWPVTKPENFPEQPPFNILEHDTRPASELRLTVKDCSRILSSLGFNGSCRRRHVPHARRRPASAPHRRPAFPSPLPYHSASTCTEPSRKRNAQLQKVTFLFSGTGDSTSPGK